MLSRTQAAAATLIVSLAAALGMLVLLPAVGVSAHAAYDHSTPEADSVVAAAPAQVDVYFKQEMARGNGLPTLTVAADSGDIVSGDSVLDDNDRTHMSVPLDADLPDGRYTVVWHNVSADDGDEATGVFFFYVGSGPEPSVTAPPGSATTGATGTPIATATVKPAENEDGDSGDIPVWGLIAGIVGGLVVGGGGGLAFGRRGGS